MRSWIIAAVFLAGVLAPEASDACAVCFSGRDENRLAFTTTTVFLTALPLVMIGSVVGWLRWLAAERRARDSRG